MLKIFISIESIQEEISEFLLEKLAELIDNPNAFATSRLLIHQFKGTLSEHSWPIIEKLLQMLDVSPRTIQSEIISSLPDIVSDQNHENVIETLKILLKENSMDSLTAVLLDALSNLNIKATQKCDILDYAKELLVTANADDLPILIKFLLMNSDKDTISGIVPNVRQSICEFMESRSKHGEDCLVLILCNLYSFTISFSSNNLKQKN